VDDADRKPWAVLAYTIADDKGDGNPIDATAKLELKAMCEGADFGLLSLATQVDFKHTPGVFRAKLVEPPPPTRDFDKIDPQSSPLWRDVQRKLRGRTTFEVAKEKEDLNSARADVLQAFVQWGLQECPADRHVLFFYGHAYGPMGLFYDTDVSHKQKLPGSLRITDLARALNGDGRRIPIVMFRDCFVNTLEVAYELRNVAEFMIASQSLVPIAGIWPWGYFMDALMPSASTADQAAALAKGLGRFLEVKENRRPFSDAPISLLDLGQADSVADKLKAVVEAIQAARSDPQQCATIAEQFEASRCGYPNDHKQPGDPSLIDLPGLCDRLAATTVPGLADVSQALGEAVARFIKCHHTQGDVYRGVSLFYKPVKPEDLEASYLVSGNPAEAQADVAYYKTLALCARTGWDQLALNPLPLAAAI
jgi:hypothetical protein